MRRARLLMEFVTLVTLFGTLYVLAVLGHGFGL